MKPALGKKLGQNRTRTVTVALSFASLTVFALFVLIVAFQDQLGLNSAALDKVRTNFINNFIVENRWLWLVDGLAQKLINTFFATLLGVAIGLLIRRGQGAGFRRQRIFSSDRFADIT